MAHCTLVAAVFRTSVEPLQGDQFGTGSRHVDGHGVRVNLTRTTVRAPRSFRPTPILGSCRYKLLAEFLPIWSSRQDETHFTFRSASLVEPFVLREETFDCGRIETLIH